MIMAGSMGKPSLATSHTCLQPKASLHFSMTNMGRASQLANSTRISIGARDLVAASEEARRLARGRYGRLGLYGISQGGWVSPLAANEARADFMVINSSGIFSPLEEDAGEVINNLRAKGHGEEVLAKAREVIAAAQVVRTSKYLQGFEQLARIKEK